MLSIGCGDGTVDAAVAAALGADGHPVAYVGVEPHGPSGIAFLERLAAVPGVTATVLDSPFAQARPTGRFDVVLAVHSLYYEADLAAALRRAEELLAPGGELVVLHAPREPLNALVGVLAAGHPQQFAGELAGLLGARGRRPEVTRLRRAARPLGERRRRRRPQPGGLHRAGAPPPTPCGSPSGPPWPNGRCPAPDWCCRTPWTPLVLTS